MLLRFIRIYQRKRYRTDFSPSASVHGTLETFTVEILNRSRRTETDRYQDGGRGRGTDEPQSRRLCNGGPSRGLAGPHERGERPARLVPPSRLPLHSPLFTSLLPLLCGTPLFSTSSLFFSRGLVFILATTGTTNANRASEGYEARRSEQVRYRLTWNLISAKCHRPRVGKQRPRRFPGPNSGPRNGIPKINEMSPTTCLSQRHIMLFSLLLELPL